MAGRGCRRALFEHFPVRGLARASFISGNPPEVASFKLKLKYTPLKSERKSPWGAVEPIRDGYFSRHGRERVVAVYLPSSEWRCTVRQDNHYRKSILLAVNRDKYALSVTLGGLSFIELQYGIICLNIIWHNYNNVIRFNQLYNKSI